MVKEQWHDDYGDRRQELVFIGLKAEMHEDQLRQQLDACLIRDFLDDPSRYESLADPFPKWFEQAE